MLRLDSKNQRSGGRVVDCCRLESDRAFAGPVGSNPTRSSKISLCDENWRAVCYESSKHGSEGGSW